MDFSNSPGAQCSAVPAGGMQKSNPTVNRDSWSSVINSWNPFAVGGAEGGFFHIKWFQTLTDPHFLRWILLFSYYSLTSESVTRKEQQDHMFKFTLFALDKMKEVLKELKIEEYCGINCGGALHFHYSDIPIKKSKNPSLSIEPVSRINSNDLLAMESCVSNWPKSISYADFETESCAGNCELFTRHIADIAKWELGVNFLMNTEVKLFDIEKYTSSTAKNSMSTIKTIHTTKGIIDIDDNTEVIIAAGSWTPKLLWLCGYFAPIYPMKGYSVSVDLPQVGSNTRPKETDIPSRMLIDQKMYISRVGEQVRITSMGEFCGWDTKPDPKIDSMFRDKGRIRIPALQPLFDATPTRCGLRPYSADGIIILGRIKTTTNLSVNVGPGFNGWKISIGAADVLANTLVGSDSGQDYFDSTLLSPSQRIVSSPLWCLISRIRWSC